jgi:hypothetical protein
MGMKWIVNKAVIHCFSVARKYARQGRSEDSFARVWRLLSDENREQFERIEETNGWRLDNLTTREEVGLPQ